MRIIVMGSSEFALPALKKLIEHYHVVAVYTREAKPAGRGMKLSPTPIEIYAKHHNIPVFTPKNFKSEQAIYDFKNLKPDIAVVAAYGILLPQIILDIPPYGCLNIHGSLLPRWRGAAPIHRAIMTGDSETGVSIMQMSAGLDEGDVFAMHALSLNISDTTGEIHDRLAEIGGDLLIDVIDKILNKHIVSTPQDNHTVTYAHKITKQECALNFIESDAHQIIQKINALNPFPSAFFIHKGQRHKIHQAELIETSGTAGMIDDNFVIYCKKYAIRPIIIQKEGRKKQHITDFLNGEKNNQGSHK
jgi:methionyl-tRNA formyltransferase